MTTPPQLFVSHARGEDGDNHRAVAAIVVKLQALGLRTWFDSERLTGDILSKIDDGIRESDYTLVCATQTYLEKVASSGKQDYCKMEFSRGVSF